MFLCVGYVTSGQCWYGRWIYLLLLLEEGGFSDFRLLVLISLLIKNSCKSPVL